MFKKLSIISASLIALGSNVSIEAMSFGAMRRFAAVGLSQVVRTLPSFNRNAPTSLARHAFFGGSFLSFCIPPMINFTTCVASRFPEQQPTIKIPTLLPTRYCNVITPEIKVVTPKIESYNNNLLAIQQEVPTPVVQVAAVMTPPVAVPMKKKRPAPLNFIEATKEYEDKYCASWIAKEREIEFSAIQEFMQQTGILASERRYAERLARGLKY